MSNFEQGTSHKSTSSPAEERNEDEDDERNIDERLDVTEQEAEIRCIDDDNLDDSKDYDVDEDVVDEGEEEREIDDNEDEVEEGTMLQPDKAQSAIDGFDAFEFVHQDTDGAGADTNIEEETAIEESDWLDGDKLYTSRINRSRHLVCVDYPGVIQNHDKALATLGGLDMLTKVVSENLKLELAFRPDDPYCKPTIGSFNQTKNLLIKIKRRPKVTKELSDSSTGDGFEYKLEVVGVVDKVYIFDKLCDFQYLPVTKEPDGTYKDILSSIRPNINDDRQEYLSRNVPLFLPPFSFSRRDIPVNYSFDTETIQPGEDYDNIIGIDRKKRFHGAIHISFDHPDVPREPDPTALQHLKRLPSQHEALEVVRKLFEDQPLWSRAKLIAHVEKVHQSYLKYLLPVLSFYFVNGPWKNLWCKFGYDPRKDPKSKIYQTLDYRVRSKTNRQRIEAKRQDVLRYAHSGLKPQWNTIMTHPMDTTSDSTQPQAITPLDLTYVFDPAHIPPYRQMRYQVCDVHHEEIQRRMHENDGQETVCTERDGWCVPDFTDVSRDLISAAVDKLFEKRHEDVSL